MPSSVFFCLLLLLLPIVENERSLSMSEGLKKSRENAPLGRVEQQSCL